MTPIDVITNRNIKIKIIFSVPPVPSVKGKPLVFIPKKPTIKLSGRKIAEIIVREKIKRFIFSLLLAL